VRIVVPDLGLSNLWSVGRALEVLGHEAVPTRDPETVAAADFLVLPGVGAFGEATSRLAQTGIGEAIRAAAGRGGRVLGICLGMQLLFESSEEAGGSRGLGLLPGDVARLSGEARVPHIGWNRVVATERGAPLFGNGSGADLYFVHSFAARPSSEDVVLARCFHGESFPAAVRQGAFLGFQFHPEKSGEAGVRLLGRAIASLSRSYQ
jgi:glutamine amidotransferase